MPRPQKCRMIGFIPKNSYFVPEIKNDDEVILSVEEFEALRLSDYMGMEQDNAAQSMNVSRGTYQRIVNTARHKVADAFVHGKQIKIDGGNYKLYEGLQCCKRHNGNCRLMKCEKCEKCKDCIE